METVEIAKVAVCVATYAIDRPYDYLVPESLRDRAAVGARVTVPFGRGNRCSEGIILRRAGGPRTPSLKALLRVLDEEPVLDANGIALASFLRQRCFCTMYEAVRTILPAGLWYRLRVFYALSDGVSADDAEVLARQNPHFAAIWDCLRASGGRAELSALKTACGDRVAADLRGLCQAGTMWAETEAERKLGDQYRRVALLTVSVEEALAEAERKQRKSPVRSAALRLLAETPRISATDLKYFSGATMQTLRGLEKSGFLALVEEEMLRVPENQPTDEGAAPAILNDEQERVFQSLRVLLNHRKAEAALIQGVTGSGKTEIYLHLVEETLSMGRGAVVLVPEIVLTPQMMQKFSARFGARVVVLHSGLKLTERYDQWKRIRRGEVDVVLGTRSAVFAPLRDPGLFILDEEQESSYQSENSPRYHARDVAKFRCAQSGALLVLGSATPSVESAYAARQSAYHLELLRRRYNEQALPQVTIADLRAEIRSGNSGAVGRELAAQLEENFAHGEQSILFLNRRGNSRMLLCGECGKVPECPRCSVPMTYHSANGRLMCHYCGHTEPAYDTCPLCGGYMKHIGTGTQKVEEELRERFPGIGVLRMDADTTAGGHEKLLRQFETEKIPILLGTQMVTKGLNFENVTLVGVLAADLSLYVDHYRAAERTFSLLTQVVGRAGRGGKTGRAVIQTYTPENEIIRAAAEQDYDRFYESELRLRRIRRYPPFADLLTLTLSGTDEGRVLRAAVQIREELRALFPASGKDAPEVLGPAAAPVLKVNNRYRYRCFLVAQNDKLTRDRLAWLLQDFAARGEHRGVSLYADCNAME